MKRPASGRKNTKSNDSSTESGPKIPLSVWSRANFAICVEAGGHVDLNTDKVYNVVSDSDALHSGMVRIVDESGEDYLYPLDWFVPVNLTKIVKSVLIAKNSGLFPGPNRIDKSPARTTKVNKSNESESDARVVRKPKRTPIVKHRTS